MIMAIIGLFFGVVGMVVTTGANDDTGLSAFIFVSAMILSIISVWGILF